MKSYTCHACNNRFWTDQRPLKKGGRIVCYECHSGRVAPSATPFDVARSQIFAGSGDGSKAPRASTVKASPSAVDLDPHERRAARSRGAYLG